MPTDWYKDGGSSEEEIDKVIKDIEDSPKTKYNEKDAARDTDVSLKEVSKNWHTARDDAEEDGEIQRSKNR